MCGWFCVWQLCSRQFAGSGAYRPSRGLRAMSWCVGTHQMCLRMSEGKKESTAKTNLTPPRIMQTSLTTSIQAPRASSSYAFKQDIYYLQQQRRIRIPANWTKSAPGSATSIGLKIKEPQGYDQEPMHTGQHTSTKCYYGIQSQVR